ncbi:uncharacterized protein BJ171DRAFT_485245 [Polychytrium aggregatum]|uniref:uncharacterized protein n=1 Tax=Polychytrium aggregatum TaxID=110093 RepID=UPI0022FE9433|nr:uncharacterized protein BJ171DRAFT_485245 [Polychytrium aggregatum]KAI9209854.1 hypothetical protein BJ171DRAFT_485245 [Polychytrium aggregatum]
MGFHVANVPVLLSCCPVLVLWLNQFGSPFVISDDDPDEARSSDGQEFTSWSSPQPSRDLYADLLLDSPDPPRKRSSSVLSSPPGVSTFRSNPSAILSSASQKRFTSPPATRLARSPQIASGARLHSDPRLAFEPWLNDAVDSDEPGIHPASSTVDPSPLSSPAFSELRWDDPASPTRPRLASGCPALTLDAILAQDRWGVDISGQPGKKIVGAGKALSPDHFRRMGCGLSLPVQNPSKLISPRKQSSPSSRNRTRRADVQVHESSLADGYRHHSLDNSRQIEQGASPKKRRRKDQGVSGSSELTEKQQKRLADQRMAAEEKKKQAQLKHINTKWDARTACSEMTVQIDRQLVSTVRMLDRLKEALQELGARVEICDHRPANIICWKRDSARSWSPARKMFVPVPTSGLEKHVVYWLNAAEYAQQVKDGCFVDKFEELRRCFPDCSVHYFITGLEQYFRKANLIASHSLPEQAARSSGNRSRRQRHSAGVGDVVARSQIEESLLRLQINGSGRCFITLLAEHEAEGWIVGLTKALATRVQKMALRDALSGLNADPRAARRSAASLSEAWMQMLQLIPGVGENKASAIARKYPSLSLLMSAYESLEVSKARQLLASLEYVVPKSGNTKSIGAKVAARIHHVITAKVSDEQPIKSI